ncbi:MAG: LysM peptidoglycan-binding domain-containing protein [Alistipes sp.]|nr:LysM peptidoglycan-binding domain-containing protein [Alistipes sp.]
MRNLKFIHTLLLLAVALPAMATQPTNIIVEVDGRSYYKHLVASGDTIYALSKVYNVPEQQILDCNEGVTPTTLKADSYLYIPHTATLEKESKAEDKKRFIYHRVKSGDTIYSIARKYKVSVATLERDNPDIDIERISPDMEVRVRRSERGYVTMDDIDKEQRKRDAEVVLKSNEYRVMAGETVYSLSRRFGLSEEAFMAMNALKSPRDLKEGMIVIRTKSAETVSQAEVVTPEPVESETAVVEEQPATQTPEEGVTEVVVVDEPMVADTLVTAFQRLSPEQPLRTLLMLPFHKGGKVNTTAVDFYRGVLLAMEDLRSEGYNIELSVLDTQGSEAVVEDIVSYDPLFYGTHLIIGPVYENEISKVLPYATATNTPVVSPLADITSLQGSVLFQMQTENNHKYDRFAEVFDGSREVVVIHTPTVDSEYKAKMYEFSANHTRYELNYEFDRGSLFYYRNADGTNGAEVDITEFMRSRTSKAFVVLAGSETDVDRVLTTLSSTKASILGRGGLMGDYIVVGNRRWKQMMSIDKQTFFNNNTIFLVPYHANRGNDIIAMYDARYVKAYEVLPTMYSYRGYDAAMIFCRRMFEGFEGIGEAIAPLTTPYAFTFEDGLYVNTYWIMERYNSNYTIDVE